MARECANPYCEATFHQDFPHDLCPLCLANLSSWAETMLREIGVTLALEAEFVQWCADHGQPNPHE